MMEGYRRNDKQKDSRNDKKIAGMTYKLGNDKGENARMAKSK